MYFSDRMSAEKKKIKKWQCFGNGYLMATCPHTKGQMADMTFIEVMLDRQFSDNKILKWQWNICKTSLYDKAMTFGLRYFYITTLSFVNFTFLKMSQFLAIPE